MRRLWFGSRYRFVFSRWAALRLMAIIWLCVAGLLLRFGGSGKIGRSEPYFSQMERLISIFGSTLPGGRVSTLWPQWTELKSFRV